MDNQFNVNLPPPREEPPLQQQPNAAPPQPPTPVPPQEPTPAERPPKPPKKKKTPLMIIIIVAGFLVVSAIALAIWWMMNFGVGQEGDTTDDGIPSTEAIMITNIDELMDAYTNRQALNCGYNITIDGVTYTVSEYANRDWVTHKIVTTGGGAATTTTLSLSGDTVYSWGQTVNGEEFANKVSWAQVAELENSELLRQFNTSDAIAAAKDSIGELVCVTADPGPEFSIPNLNWVDAGATLDTITGNGLEGMLAPYAY